jgi:hypothetical protein
MAAQFYGAAAPTPASMTARIPSVDFFCRECGSGLGLIWAQMGLGGPQPCAAFCIVVHLVVVRGVVLRHEGT